MRWHTKPLYRLLITLKRLVLILFAVVIFGLISRCFEMAWTVLSNIQIDSPFNLSNTYVSMYIYTWLMLRKMVNSIVDSREMVGLVILLPLILCLLSRVSARMAASIDLNDDNLR